MLVVLRAAEATPPRDSLLLRNRLFRSPARYCAGVYSLVVGIPPTREEHAAAAASGVGVAPPPDVEQRRRRPAAAPAAAMLMAAGTNEQK